MAHPEVAMLRLCLLLLSFFLPRAAPYSRVDTASAPDDAPTYTHEGRLQFPEGYREWVFLTSGTDMSYDPKPDAAVHTMFDNVFVNPSAYKAFLQTGTWPDKTLLVLENRAGEGNHSINTRGRTQTVRVTGIEVHVKDASGPQAKLPGGWGFFSFNGPGGAKLTPRPADCYTCHEAHAAVDTTFVQFYPTLVELAGKKNTLSPAFLKELPGATSK